MNKTLSRLLTQRITVTAVLFLLLLFIIMPLLAFTDIFPSKYDIDGDLTAIENLIAISWVIMTLGWLIFSSYFAQKLNNIPQTTDFVTAYEDGVEVLADVYTLGQSKKIGLKNIKTIFACHALFIAFLLLFFMVVAAINIEILGEILDSSMFQLFLFFAYFSVIIGGFKKMKGMLK